ncbi:hypothetical protein [Plesiocystis pacifica]|uniref:hypothetical protein n=1 Tax=Plesiocystis pacifica TaxID=191768 RepID=UPI0012FCA653|nr:hypothetical protein [Plesiocystis pacifica]
MPCALVLERGRVELEVFEWVGVARECAAPTEGLRGAFTPEALGDTQAGCPCMYIWGSADYPESEFCGVHNLGCYVYGERLIYTSTFSLDHELVRSVVGSDVVEELGIDDVEVLVGVMRDVELGLPRLGVWI